MSDKEWLLNAAAIKVARQCIKIVDEELGVRLTLSHPDFLQLLEEYSQLTDSSRLVAAVRELSNYASPSSAIVERQTIVAIGGQTASRVLSPSGVGKSVGRSNQSRASLALVDAKKVSANSSSHSQNTPLERRVQAPERRNDIVPFHGKNYRRWNEGKEFQGLYRGHPRYA